MRELAVQAANDTNDSNDRTNLALEMSALTDEIDRIADVTSWAGQILLDGASPDSNATAHSDEASFDFQIGSGTNASSDVLTVDIGATTSAALGLSATSSAFADAPQGLVDYSGLTLPTDSSGDATFTMTVDAGTAAGAAGPAGDEHLELTVALANSSASTPGVPSGSFSFYLENQQITVTLGADNTTIDNAGVAQAIANAINDAGIAGITANAGIDNDGDASAADVQVIKAVGADISSGSAALTTIGLIDTAITTINAQRASLGSASNRLDSTVSNLTNISSNLQAGRGRIEDADFAVETTSLAKSQILQQASTAMLAQANASKQNVLSLLQG
jgi:flagellin